MASKDTKSIGPYEQVWALNLKPSGARSTNLQKLIYELCIGTGVQSLKTAYSFVNLMIK